MLQSDLFSLEFEYGRLLVLAGKYVEGEAKLRRALDGFERLHTESDGGPGSGIMLSWLGEAQLGMRHYTEALHSFRQAIDYIDKDVPYDDGRCGMAADYSRIGDILTKLSRLAEAEAAYNKALEVARPQFSIAHQDIPALYPLADAQFGLGEVLMAKARKTSDHMERVRLEIKSCATYQQSLNTWNRVPHLSRFNPNYYPSGASHLAAIRLARCGTMLMQNKP